jgi:hypothetical protein
MRDEVLTQAIVIMDFPITDKDRTCRIHKGLVATGGKVIDVQTAKANTQIAVDPLTRSIRATVRERGCHLVHQPWID